MESKRQYITITKEDLANAQTVNTEGLGVIKFWREDQKDGTQRLYIGLYGKDTGLGSVNFLGKWFGNIQRGVALVNQTKKADHLNAYKIYAEQNGLEVGKLTDAQAVEALARFSIDWEQRRAEAFRNLEGFDIDSRGSDISV